MAAAAATFQGAVSAIERRSLWTGTPEIYFTKTIDNSRLVQEFGVQYLPYRQRVLQIINDIRQQVGMPVVSG